MSKIDQLKPAIYNFKNDSKKSIGFIAQDLLEIFPDNEYSIVKKDQSGFYMVEYYQLIPLLVSEIQKLKKKIEKLENVVDHDLK